MKRKKHKKDSAEWRWLAVIGCGTLLAAVAFTVVFHDCFHLASTSTKASFLAWRLILYFIHI